MATPNLPPEWLLRLQQLQQMQEQQQAEQSAGIGGAAALQAGPQEQFDARFAGLDSALASAQNPQPPLPALPSWEERALAERPYVTGEIKPFYAHLPWLNALGRGVKKTPVLGEAVGGLADLAASAGTSYYHPNHSLAAAADALPVGGAAIGTLAKKTGKPLLQKAQNFYNKNFGNKAAVESVANIVPWNRYELDQNDPVHQRNY